MNTIIMKMFVTCLAYIVAHKIISTIIMLIVGFVGYCYFFNPSLLGEVIERIQDLSPALKDRKVLEGLIKK